MTSLPYMITFLTTSVTAGDGFQLFANVLSLYYLAKWTRVSSIFDSCALTYEQELLYMCVPETTLVKLNVRQWKQRVWWRRRRQPNKETTGKLESDIISSDGIWKWLRNIAFQHFISIISIGIDAMKSYKYVRNEPI